jgi:Fic family protein
MDIGLWDEEGAIRQRYIELDDRSEDVREAIERSACGWEGFQEMLTISWIYHENGLEGVVLTFPEIKSAVSNKVISDVSLMPIYNEIKNQRECIDTMREKALSKRFVVTVPFLKELHAKLVRQKSLVDHYRKDIPIHRTYFHEIAQPANIEAELIEVLEYLKTKPEKDLHPIEFAANFHHRFMRVFPFTSTSGIIGRLLLNFVLLRQGYMPIIIHSSDRQLYYEALRSPERDFRAFVCGVMENSLDNATRFVASQGSQVLRVAH